MKGKRSFTNNLYPETLQLLLQSPSGPRLDAVDTNFGRTAAHWAVFYKRHDLLLQLMMAGTVYVEVSVIVLPVLRMQSSHGDYFTIFISLLIDIYQGADMTAPDFTGTSPFHLAISEKASVCLQEAIRYILSLLQYLRL